MKFHKVGTIHTILQISRPPGYLIHNVMSNTNQPFESTMSMIFEADEMDQKLQMVLKIAPPWPNKPKAQPFAWPHGPHELIAERNRVAQIMALRVKVEKPMDHNGTPTKYGYPMSFKDAFMQDNSDLALMILEIENFRDWRSLTVKEHLHTFPVGPSGTAEIRARRERDWCASMNFYYNLTEAVLQKIRNNLLEMYALCSELKPETLALVKRCSSYEQLDRSMLMMNPEPKAEGFPFEAPRGLSETPQEPH